MENTESISAYALGNIDSTVKTREKYPTEPSFLLPIGLTAILILIPFLIFWKIHLGIDPNKTAGSVFQILWGNWVSPIIVWFFFATLLYLIQKRRLLKREIIISNTLVREIVPKVLEQAREDDSRQGIYQRLEQGLSSIHPSAASNSLMLSRCCVLLGSEQLNSSVSKGGSSIEEMAGQFDYDKMQASYSLPRFMIWAIPILGFIGTVWESALRYPIFQPQFLRLNQQPVFQAL